MGRKTVRSVLEVQAIWTGDRVPIRRWQPDDPEVFCTFVVVEVGPRGKHQGPHYFSIRVASPPGIAALPDEPAEPFIAGPRLLVMRRWDVDAVCAWIEARVAECGSHSEVLALDRLRRDLGYVGQ